MHRDLIICDKKSMLNIHLTYLILSYLPHPSGFFPSRRFALGGVFFPFASSFSDPPSSPQLTTSLPPLTPRASICTFQVLWGEGRLGVWNGEEGWRDEREVGEGRGGICM